MLFAIVAAASIVAFIHYGNRGSSEQTASDSIKTLTTFEPEMVYVEGGTFTMGSNNSDDWSASPPHKATLSSYSIGKYEITQAQWTAVMGINPSEFKGCDNCPVEMVSWNDAQVFISKLNAAIGKNYRLPTETEWEFAAYGGTKSKGYKYSGSNNIDDVAWHWDNSDHSTHPVGVKAPNELGIYDMSGNVWEWVSDWYDVNNPTVLSSDSYRIYRGGGWVDGSIGRVMSRRFADFNYRRSTIGFRVVLSPPSVFPGGLARQKNKSGKT